MGFMKTFIYSVLIALLFAFVWRVFFVLDLNKVAYNHRPGQCWLVDPVVHGSEDIALVPGTGLAIVTSGLKWVESPDFAGVVGKLFEYDFNKGGATGENKKTAVEIKIQWANADKAKHFNPHGIKILTQNGIHILYVINHEPTGHAIELFEYDSAKKVAKHVKTIRHELIFSPNNLIVVGPEKFYISNDRYFSHHLMLKVELLLPIFKLGCIVYYDKGAAKVVDNFLFMPNGLEVDKSKKFLFASLVTSKMIQVYKINSEDGSLVRHKSINVGTLPDNLFYDQSTNSVWIGSHPIGHEVTLYMERPRSSTAPSQVLRIDFKNANFDQYEIHEVYADDGRQLHASTVAVKYGKQILIGTICHKLMLCNLNS